MGASVHRVDWESLWSLEAKKKQLPSLHGIVSRYTKEPDVIGMHGGLPPSNTFPFTSFQSGLLPLSEPNSTTGATTADNNSNNKDQTAQQAEIMCVSDPHLVATAQQYNMQAQGYPPLVSWARDLVTSLHKPATLHGTTQPVDSTSNSSTSSSSSSRHNTPDPHQQQQQQQQQYEPVGMDVVITPGASAALDSLVRVLVNPGDAVLVEEYTYAHMAEAHLLPLGCELLPVPLDGGGLVPSALDDLLTARQAAGKPLPKLLYTIPTGQNPTGSVMSAERMAQVYAVARKWGLIIIEDDAYYWLQYQHGPDNVPGLNLRPGFLSLDVDGRVVRVDTLAKLLGPGFRLGWLSGPPPLVSKLALYMAGISIGANMVSQVMLHQLLAHTWGRAGFEAFVMRLQAQYARQAAVAAQAAEQQLAGLAEWAPACAGMFMWFKLTGDLDSESLIEAAAANKVMVVPGHLISVPHLQAAHRRRLVPQQQAEQAKAQQQLLLQQQQQVQGACLASAAAPACIQEVLHQLQGVTQQLQQQQLAESDAGPEKCEAGCGSSLQDSQRANRSVDIAAQLSIITQQLQRLQELGNSSAETPFAALSATAATTGGSVSATVTTPAATAAEGGSGAAGLGSFPESQSVTDADVPDPAPCPFFRVSFVSVPADAIQEGFVRLRAAILSCHGPRTPPGEETEIYSCSSSMASSNSNVGVVPGAGVHHGGGHAAPSDSAMC